EHIKVESGYEAAIAAAFGSLADAVLADSWDAGVAALRHARDAEAGRVEIVVADAAAPADPTGLPAGVRSAASLVTGPNGIRGVLAGVVVADDLEVARAAWPALAKLGGITVITRAGDVLAEHVLRGGSGAGRSRIELLAERDAAQQKLVGVTTTIERLAHELAEQREKLDLARIDLVQASTALKQFETRLAERSEALGRSRVQLEAAAAESERLAEAMGGLGEQVAVAEAGVEKAIADRDAHAATPRPMLDVSARDELLSELENARAVEVAARVELETARVRVRAQREQAEQLKRRLETERAAAEEAARLAVIRRHQIEAAQGVIEVLPAVLDTADRSVAEARVALAAAEADRAKQNEELAELRRTEAGLRERLAALNENVHGLEMQAYEKKLHLSSLLERAADELGLVEDVLVAEYGPHVPVPVDAPAAAASPAADVPPASAAPSPAAMSKMQENSEHPPENSGADADAEAGSPAFSTIEAGDDAPDAAQQTDAVATEPFDRAKQKARLEKAERK